MSMTQTAVGNAGHRYCVVMCGGIGSRFWPFSRSGMPKQFIDFFGTGRSLLQMTVDRIRPLVAADHIFIVTNRRYADMVMDQLPDIAADHILCEPDRRNTAPCVCWASHHIAALDPEAAIMTVPSDHLILKEDAFVRAMDEGMRYAEQHDALLTLGLTPTRPETGYGYIQKGAPVDGWTDLMKVKTFIEKPNAEMARILLQSGDFLWNAGIFLWRAEVILRAFERLAPEVAAVFNEGKGLYGTPDEEEFIARRFSCAPNVSVDYAIMEKASNVFVVGADLGWSDLGTWRALYENSERTAEGNVTQNCDVIADECENTLFAVKGDKLVVAAGLKDYVVAENGNTLLISPLDDEARLRRLVNEVKEKYGDKYL